jgi:hypothetical protein
MAKSPVLLHTFEPDIFPDILQINRIPSKPGSPSTLMTRIPTHHFTSLARRKAE